MRVTNEVREYIQRAVASKLPEPSCKAEYKAFEEEIKEACKIMQEEVYRHFQKLVNDYKASHPAAEKVEFVLNHTYRDRINVEAGTTATDLYKELQEAKRERDTFQDAITKRLFIQASFVKSMEELDKIIAEKVG